MSSKLATEIVSHACRWCQNILVEILNNYGEAINPEARDCIRAAIEALTGIHSKL